MAEGNLTSKQESLLRKAAAEIRAEGHNGWGNVCEQGADEIERLTAEKDALAGENLRAFQQIDRLRAALERIAANDHITSPHPVGPSMGAGVNQGLAWNARLAREALAEQPDEMESSRDIKADSATRRLQTIREIASEGGSLIERMNRIFALCTGDETTPQQTVTGDPK